MMLLLGRADERSQERDVDLMPTAISSIAACPSSSPRNPSSLLMCV
jgi:hypothetical protein